MSRFVLTAQLQLQAPNNVAQVVRQIQSQLNNINVNLNVQGGAQAQRQLQQVTAQTNAATTAAQRMGRAFAVSVRRFAAFSIATRAVGLFTSTLSDAIRTAIDFERQMIKVSQVTGDSMEKLRGLTKSITDLSTSLGVPSQSLLEVSTLLLQAGVSARDTEVALKTLAKAALAPNFDSITETAEGAIAILAQFGEGVGALEKQLGAINAVAGAFAVEAGDLIDVIRRTGGVFKASGGDLNELIALFTSVRATTRESAESISTGLRTIFTRIQRPKTIEFLRQFGVELVDLNGKFVGPYEAVRRLSEALSGLGEGDITFIRIAEELGGFRQIGKVLPLLQQFSTAQQALNVANQAGNSLTKDAATAQEALAIRIVKVKEEFLALVRGITETKTFQIMANTALSLASALIKIADAIKPLLPMLATLAAVNLAKGLGSFAGGLMAGMRSGRTFSHGGPVKRFARGGLVPGSGNRDTVPAMLMPGEFVIKKSSVNKLGASNLAAMNENRFLAGGVVRSDRGFYGNIGPDGRSLVGKTKGLTLREALNAGFTRSQLSSAYGKDAVDQATGMTSAQAQAAMGRKKGEDPNSVISGARLSTRYGVSFLEGGISGNLGATINQVMKSGNATGVKILQQAIAKDGRRVLPGARLESPNASVAFLQPDAKDIFDNEIMGGLPKLFDEATSKFGAPLKPGKVGINELVSNSAVQAIKGYFFEGFARRVSQNLLTDSAQDKTDPIFDFTGAGNVGDLKRMFGGKFIDPNEFKVSPTTDNIANAISKAISLRGTAGLQFFAKGGGVGTDTVPALLTPGEFVINRKSAQNIGYGNLSRMNKIGKYANGGIVQSFQTGGSVDAPSQKIGIPSLTKVEASFVKLSSVLDKFTMGTFSKLNVGIEHVVRGFLKQESTLDKLNRNYLYLDSVIPGSSKILQENAKINKRGLTAQIVLVDTIADYVGSLQKSGGTQKQVNDGLKKYLNYVNKNTANLQSGVTLPTLAGTAKPSAATTSQPLAQNTTAIRNNTRANNSAARSAVEVASNNKMFAASMAVSLIQGFLPAVDKNSSATLRVTHALLGLVTTITSVGFALEVFGAKLSAKGLMDFFGGKGFNVENMMGGLQNMGLSTGFAKSITGATQALSKLAGPVIAVVGSAYLVTKAFSTVIEAIYNFEGRLQTAIESGNVEEAKRVAAERADFQGVNTVRGITALGGAAVGAAAGAAIGTAVAPVIGTAIGALIGAIAGAIAGTLATFLPPGVLDTINVMFGGNTRDSAIKLAAAQAGLVKVQNELQNAQRTATDSMAEFEKGTLSASEALQRIRLASSEVSAQQTRAIEATLSNIQNKARYEGLATGEFKLPSSAMGGAQASMMGTGLPYAIGGYGLQRDIMSLGGLLGETSSQRNARIDKENADLIGQSVKATLERSALEAPARTAAMRQGLLMGQSREEVFGQSSRELQSAIAEFSVAIKEARDRGDTETANMLMDQSLELTRELSRLAHESVNLEKEIGRVKAALEAMNLGLRGPTATANAMSASMDKFVALTQVGGDAFGANVQYLSQAVTSAAQAMNPESIKQSVDSVSAELKQMGISPQYVAKFEGNTVGLIQAQQKYNEAIKQLISDMGTEGEIKDPTVFKQKLAERLSGMLDVADPFRENIMKMIEGMNLSGDEVAAIIGGDLSIFGVKLGEVGQKQFEELLKIAAERSHAEQQLISLTQQRIESERSFVEAQKEAIDLFMEGREVQAKYGGRSISQEERRAAILARSNVSRVGLPALRTGSVAELRARNVGIAGQVFGVETRRRTEGGMARVTGVIDDATQRDLQNAQKDQIQTIRDLIKLEEESLKIIQEKNKLEKESLNALITGDIEKFFEQQAASGAQAAIAAGNMDVANMFGADAVAKAFQDIMSQMEAGVQTMFGQQLAGQGGLAEQAARAALAARGVNDPRMAQMMAGTSPEEQAIQNRLQELGGLLGETGAWQQALSEMQVQTASIIVDKAQVELRNIEERGRAAAMKMNRGGIVYANNGIFVPRGTDTVPAMLTPGEFVVRREAVNRGNNLQLLRAINNGGGSGAFSRGGKVNHYNQGGMVQYKARGDTVKNMSGLFGIDPQIITNLSNTFTQFTNNFNESIKNLQNTRLRLTMDSVNVNVNINGGSALAGIRDEVKKEIMSEVINKIKNDYGVGDGGRIVQKTGNLPQPSSGM